MWKTLAGCVLLSGCATTPIDSRSAPAAASSMGTPFDGAGLIVVVRDSGLMGSACSHMVFMDGTDAGSLSTGQRLNLYVHPGDHMLGLKVPLVCGGATLEAAVSIAVGERKAYRSSSGQSGEVHLAPTGF